MTTGDTSAVPAAGFQDQGWWRSSTFLDDLADAVRDRGDHLALIVHEGDEKPRTLSYVELSDAVARFASALRELGVGRGDVVACYLPNLWLLAPLYLACHRIGAVSSPIFPVVGTRELGHVLRVTGAKVCVTVERNGEHHCAALLAEAAPETLAHRVVVGDAAATGAIDFDEFFVRTPWENRTPVPEEDRLGPDEPAQLMHTSGTTGKMKLVVHSQNTLYAAVRAVSEPHRLTRDDVISLPGICTAMAGLTYALYLPLFLGATGVVQKHTNDMDLLRDLIEAHSVTWLYTPPVFLVNLLAAQRKEARDTSSLKQIVTGSAPVHPQLITQVREVFDVELHALWGMTENGAVTVTRPDDPAGWAAHSDGRSTPWMEVRIDAEPGEEAGRLLVRGASQCLGYLGQRDVYDACVDAEGWFDTGDLARPDGRGGIRIVGRRADIITRPDGMQVSTLEVESLLQRHPAITEVVLVGYPHPEIPGGSKVCAVVVPVFPAISLDELHAYLAREGVAKAFWPDRVQFVGILPKNSLGKVLRQPLRERLELAAAPRS
ncbi:AMP-binding protein [Amycolatopsis sp. NPDC059657]|uniref:AMP-binding protein n=1 Tax=Amycolatopsis sp. NPDC059657 TaxID=3346899 RepID=UPI00366C3446